MTSPDAASPAASPAASTSELGAIERLAEPVCASHGVELVHMAIATERGGRVLRVLIDREVPGPDGEIRSGITLADCQGVSRDLSAELDAHDPIRGAYRLEISSPGLDRPLVKARHFERFCGSEVKIQLLRALPDPSGGKSKRRRFRGRLLGVEREGPEGPLPEEQVRIKIEVEGETFAFSITEIAKANVVHRHE